MSGSWRCCTKPYERSSGRGRGGASCLPRRLSDTDFRELRYGEVRGNGKRKDQQEDLRASASVLVIVAPGTLETSSFSGRRT